MHALIFIFLLFFTNMHTADRLWKELTIRDLKAIKRAIHDNHPGIVEQNKPLIDWLDIGYTQSIARAKDVDDMNGYLFCIKAYVNGFKDSLLTFEPFVESTRTLWSGFFITHHHDGSYRIVHPPKEHASLPAPLPPENVEILLWQNIPIKDYIKNHILPYESNRLPEIETEDDAQHICFYRGNPWAPFAHTVTYTNNGAIKTTAITWRPLHKDVVKTPQALVPISRPYNKTLFADRSVWITLPYEEDIASLRSLVSELPDMRNHKIIVFDIRGNKNIPSAWGQKIVDALWGNGFVEQCALKNRTCTTSIRLSNDNIKSLAPVTPEPVMQQMRSAFAQKNIWYTSYHKKNNTIESHANPVSATVCILTDARCAHESLSLVAEIRELPGTYHIGQKTVEDTPYVLPNTINVPSGLGCIHCPTTIKLTGYQGNRGCYKPDFIYRDDINDTLGLQNWVLKLYATISKQQHATVHRGKE